MLIILLLILGAIPAIIANSKGRNFVGCWLYGILIWTVAFVHSLYLPGRYCQAFTSRRAGRARGEKATGRPAMAEEPNFGGKTNGSASPGGRYSAGVCAFAFLPAMQTSPA